MKNWKIDPDRVTDQAELLGGDGGDLEVPPADEQGVKSGVVRLLMVETFMTFFDVPLDGTPAVIHVDARTENDDPFEVAAVLLKNHADEGRALSRLARTD